MAHQFSITLSGGWQFGRKSSGWRLFRAMSNVEDWERRHALPFGCAVVVTISSFLLAVFFLGYAISKWAFNYPNDKVAPFPLLLIGVFFLFGAVALTWRLATGKTITYVGRGSEASPSVEVYDFLPKEADKAKRDDET